MMNTVDCRGKMIERKDITVLRKEDGIKQLEYFYSVSDALQRERMKEEGVRTVAMILTMTVVMKMKMRRKVV